jgi:predicted Zn-dependent peptidase
VHSNNPLQAQNVGRALNPQIPVGYTKIGVQKTPTGENVHLYKLSNGQTIAIAPHEGTTIVKTFIAAGSLNETDNIRGISHFIEHNLFNGSKNLAPGDVFKKTTEMGADTNASTDFAVTDYYISSSVMDEKELQKAIEIQADMILNPSFTTDMIEKEKGPVTSEISMINDDIAGCVAQDVIKNLFQMATASKNLVGGSIETESALTREDLVNYHSKYYTPDNMYTVIVGDVDPDKTMQIVAKNFNQKPKTNPEQDRHYEKLTPLTSPKRIDVISPIDNSSNIMAGFAVPKFNSDKEHMQMMALGLLLTGYKNARLTKNLRPINSYADTSGPEIISPEKNSARAYFIYIGSPPNQTQRALDCMYKTIEDVGTNPPTKDEMAIIKNIMQKGISMAYEDSAGICGDIGERLLYGGIEETAKQKEIIDSLTPQDIVDAAQKYLDLDKVSLGIVHAKNTTEAQIKNNYFTSPYSQKTNTAAKVSFGANKPLTTQNVKQYKLADNTLAVLNNSSSDICYMNWKMTSYQSTPKNLAVPYVLTELLNNGSALRDKEQYSRDANVKGIAYDFDSNGFAITVNANCLYPNIQDALGMVKETIFSPRFNEYEFEAAKQKIASYCSTLNKDASEALIAQLYPEYFASSQQI